MIASFYSGILSMAWILFPHFFTTTITI
jgi:hypothetical protein